MGYIRHDVTLFHVDSSSSKPVEEQVNKFRNSLPEDFARLIIGPVLSPTNGYTWFLMLPDGSKEGWEISQEGEYYRAAFAELGAPYGLYGMRFGDDETTTYEGQEWLPLEDENWMY